METTRRAAGLGLLAYGLLTSIAFTGIGSPGGDYEDKTIVSYMSSGHWAGAMVIAYLGAFASLGLLVFASRMRHELRSGGSVLWGLAVAGTAAGVVGWFLVGGISVSFAEGGSALSTLPHPVVYLVSEMSNLIAVCASAFFVGAAALVVAAKAALPRSLRIASYVAGVCGLFAAFFFPIFLFWLWAIAFGGWMIATGERRPVVPEVQPELV
ncbi:MAG: hypothetical protein QOJ60_3263 [Actinomycetota bacterium]|jgi:hypothetical protein|nr:hypothetical protein [Actinomycetota bacterium]